MEMDQMACGIGMNPRYNPYTYSVCRMQLCMRFFYLYLYLDSRLKVQGARCKVGMQSVDVDTAATATAISHINLYVYRSYNLQYLPTLNKKCN